MRNVAPPLLGLQADLQVRAAGEEVGGYVLGELLTQGGMASVYLGKRVAPGGFVKTVVLKRLRPELGRQPPLVALFLREASLSAALEHPSIVRTLDLTRIDGDYYLVMEYVSGGDLRLLLRRARRRGQRFSVAAALYMALELLGALEYAHTRCTPDGRPLGLSHRDVSPANILLSAEGEVKLSDFGIAQASAPEVEATLGVRLRGKVGYMSPEQAAGMAVDARTDLFALAAVLYEVLTDKRLFIGQPGQPAAEIYDAAIVPPSQLCPELPPAFDDVLRRALARRREDGYQSARELGTALRELAREHGLWLCRLGLAEHLREVCGPDPSVWHCLEERTGTAIIPSIADFDDLDGEGREADSGSHGLVDREPPAEPICDHVITVPWPTVPDKELQPPPVLLTDDTVPLPSAVLAELKEPAGAPRQPAAGAEVQPAAPPVPAAPEVEAGEPPGHEPGAKAPEQSLDQTLTRTPAHARAPSSLPAVDFDAITSPARLVDPTVPLSVAELPHLVEPAGLAEHARPLTLSQLATTLPPVSAAPATRKLPIQAGVGQRLHELLHRPVGALTLALLALLGLGLSVLIASGADVWSWLWTRLREP
ncbi:MAG TPA: serine/threonine-protein kinase [Pseudomonadota bacterium]|nr:serine/threonine-protein kinase [Pseudomonadota bacterium]